MLIIFNRVIFPVLFGRNSRQNKTDFFNWNSNYRQTQKNEGDITVNSPSTKNKKIQDDMGEYIDYEEIND